MMLCGLSVVNFQQFINIVEAAIARAQSPCQPVLPQRRLYADQPAGGPSHGAGVAGDHRGHRQRAECGQSADQHGIRCDRSVPARRRGAPTGYVQPGVYESERTAGLHHRAAGGAHRPGAAAAMAARRLRHRAEGGAERDRAAEAGIDADLARRTGDQRGHFGDPGAAGSVLAPVQPAFGQIGAVYPNQEIPAVQLHLIFLGDAEIDGIGTLLATGS